MAQFDVHRMPGGGYALDCQSDLLSHLSSRFTVPLQPLGDRVPERVDRLHPTFEIEGRRVVMATQLAGAVPTKGPGEKVASLSDHEFTVKAALDMLISGY